MKYFIKYILLIFFVFTYGQTENVLKVVIDPFHGGKDNGYLIKGQGIFEKEINLIISKKVTELLKVEKNINVIEIRNNDLFVDLKDKIYEANSGNANLYIGINSLNSDNSTIKGSSVYILSQSDDLLAKKFAIEENKIVKKTRNYKKVFPEYNEINPDSVFLNNKLDTKYLEISNSLSKEINKEFLFNKIDVNGVYKGPFLLLHRVFMPSAIINIGYLSNEKDINLILSAKGQDKIALSIANAIINFKNNLDNNNIDLNKILGKEKSLKENAENNITSSKNNLNITDDKSIALKIENEKKELERIKKEKIEAEKLLELIKENEKEESEKIAKEKLDAEKLLAIKKEQEKKEQERIAKEKLDAEKLLAIKKEQEKKESYLTDKNLELTNLLLEIENAKTELSKIKSEIKSSKKELNDILENIESAKKDLRDQLVKNENAKGYLIKLNSEIIAKINELDKNNKNANNSSNTDNNNESGDFQYKDTDIIDESSLVYRIQIFACVICQKIPTKYFKQNPYKVVTKLREEGLNKFFIFETVNKDEAYLELKKIRDLGFFDAFPTLYKGSVRQKME